MEMLDELVSEPVEDSEDDAVADSDVVSVSFGLQVDVVDVVAVPEISPDEDGDGVDVPDPVPPTSVPLGEPLPVRDAVVVALADIELVLDTELVAHPETVTEPVLNEEKETYTEVETLAVAVTQIDGECVIVTVMVKETERVIEPVLMALAEVHAETLGESV
jgi:hypothetical protein